MRDFDEIDNDSRQRYRAYLKLLASRQVDTWLRQRIRTDREQIAADLSAAGNACPLRQALSNDDSPDGD